MVPLGREGARRGRDGSREEGRKEGAGSSVNLSLWAGSLSRPTRCDND